MKAKGMSLASSTWADQEVAAIQRVIASNRYTMGEEVVAFEREFAAFHKERFAVMVNSGSSANLLAIAGLVYHPDVDLQPGDTVLVPTVSWSTTYFPLQQLGLKLRFVDIDRSTLNIDPAKLRDAITPEVKAVFCVNLLGNSCHYEQIAATCAANNIFFLEDNCEALGGRYGDSLLGALGMCGTFSTYFSHHICTMEGGLVVTDDQTLYRTMLALRSHGWVREQDADSHLSIDADDFTRQFRFVLPGYNLRPTEMQAAVGREQLKKLPEFIRVRRENAALFRELITPIAGICLQEEIGESAWFGFSLLLEGSLSGRRAEVVAALIQQGIECRPIVAGNFLNNPAVDYLDYSVAQGAAEADYVDSNGLFVGNQHLPLEAELQLLADVLASV
jgi:CDP-6-deoxy-D-xylo-4-hexulose-3-dehydrase